MDIADDFEVVILSKKRRDDLEAQMQRIKSQVQKDEIRVLDVTRSSANDLVIVFRRRHDATQVPQEGTGM